MMMEIYKNTIKNETNEVINETVLNNLPVQGGNATKDAFQVRVTFKDYFNSMAPDMVRVQNLIVII